MTVKPNLYFLEVLAVDRQKDKRQLLRESNQKVVWASFQH